MRYFITLSLLLLVGCEAHYRYPCQDPDNWDKDFCKAPRCEVNKDGPIVTGKQIGRAHV